MRTTLRLDDDLMMEIRDLAAKRRSPIGAVTNEALRLGLQALAQPRKNRGRHREKPVKMGAPARNLDKALSLAAGLEDTEVLRKLQLRK
jgi:hypothetical protein